MTARPLTIAATVLLSMVGCARTPLPWKATAGGTSPAASSESTKTALTLGEITSGAFSCETPPCNEDLVIEIPEEGRLDVWLRTPGEGAANRPTGLTLSLLGPSGRALARPVASSSGHTSVSAEVAPGPATLRLGADAAVPYELTSHFTPRVAKVEARSFQVLEVERLPGGGLGVLLDGGRGDDLEPGQKGRLIEGGKPIGDVEILEVYDEGSRAAIEGELLGAVTHRTTVELDLPTPED